MKVLFRSITDIGDYRDYNDDSCYYDEKNGLMVMADGMGGYAGGHIASSMAVKVFHDHFMGITEDFYKEELNDLFLLCNNEITEYSKRNKRYKDMGTTLTAVCFKGEKYYIGHVGDCRAYMFRGGKLHRLTEDHNVAELLLKTGSISKKNAEKHPGNHMLTKVIGRTPMPQVDYYEGDLYKDDMILLCTDGLTGYLDEKKILAVLKSHDNPEHILNVLVQKVINNKGKDNITAILGKII